MKNFPLLVGMFLLTVGCSFEDNAKDFELGDFSLGKQFVDLKQAYDAEALTTEEYAIAKAQLLEVFASCESDDKEEEAEE